MATLKNLVSPPLVAIVLAVIFIVVGIPVPTIAESVLNTIGSTSMPLALIYIGGVLCSANLKPVLKCGELYAGIIVKMIAIPVATFFVMSQLGLPEDMSATIAYMAAPRANAR
ncbi:Membrane transport protein [Streptococcus gallolyticus]|uniref:Membrane transport protein n=1 Tax=Streptococcus gallolyticus TaxID=315405 RepID=A0A1H7WYL7_9STRE|nr:AEC family transporter [Streptococcus gallolyticus]MCY7154826.1 AEC family transporter [Streptococcus gallolyticus subsp. gallolyticus]MCY7173709.1 AEC family transporter [Streptococcus gallolyticus subsp. gallolyticus]MCY7175830.1 AEC family transporter [Streptococcus gallolyticus subsp. gallolyticus]MCY7180284.1 AEC family transporter [Streptococcus gallolyticus subsp. gallolyticus]MCY7197836.1 AEC family transporter [Streptococcus gallolyticus subsp. gallolyticus]